MNIDIKPNGAIKRVHVSQNDIGRTLTFELFNNSTSYTVPSGAVIKIQGTKPSGFGFSETCAVSGNVATIDTTEEMTDEYGYIDTELQISYSGNVIGTSNFVLAVERNPHPDSTTDGTQITAQSLQDQIDDLRDEIETGGSGLTDEAKQALLNCFSHVAWIDEDGQDYYDTLESALYPPANLVSISCVYTQSGTVYDTDSLDSLKSDLVVTAHFDDSSTRTVTTYTLSGTLTEGTSTITVTYGGKTTTFNVTVTEAPAMPLYDWDLTQSMTDSIGSVTASTNGTQSGSGVSFSGSGKYIDFGAVFAKNRTYEIDVDHIQRATANLGRYARLFMIDSDTNTATGGQGYIISGTAKNGDLFYINGAWDSNVIVAKTVDADGSYYDSSTVGFYIDDDGYISVYKDSVLLGTGTSALSNPGTNVYIGSTGSDYFDDALFTGVRVYGGNIYS